VFTITPVSLVAKPCVSQVSTQCHNGVVDQSPVTGLGSTTGLAVLAVVLLVFAAGAFLKAIEPVLIVIKAALAAAATFVLLAVAIVVLFLAVMRR
jgi:hypothetical protein